MLLLSEETQMEFLTTAEVAEKWKVSRRRVTVLCNTGRLEGAIQKGKIWLIPSTTKKTEDKRHVRSMGH